ncbi:MAG: hypothetical protein LUD12_10050 [Lachnospiraceae bacterium]|nr:hypothetical protein [Lachnospiraceae bacterium]
MEDAMVVLVYGGAIGGMIAGAGILAIAFERVPFMHKIADRILDRITFAEFDEEETEKEMPEALK